MVSFFNVVQKKKSSLIELFESNPNAANPVNEVELLEIEDRGS